MDIEPSSSCAYLTRLLESGNFELHSGRAQNLGTREIRCAASQKLWLCMVSMQVDPAILSCFPCFFQTMHPHGSGCAGRFLLPSSEAKDPNFKNGSRVFFCQATSKSGGQNSDHPKSPRKSSNSIQITRCYKSYDIKSYCIYKYKLLLYKIPSTPNMTGTI